MFTSGTPGDLMWQYSTEQRFITLRVRVGIWGIRGIFRERRFGLLHGLLERAGINLEDQLAG